MNRLSAERRAAVLTALVEGNSVRSTSRITGVAKNTILRLLTQAGVVAGEYQDGILRNLNCRRIQCDEIWSFVYGKDRNLDPRVVAESPFPVGSVWTWTAIDADTKLMLSWFVGNRDDQSAAQFIRDIAERITSRIQMTTDGLALYLNAIEGVFRGEIDYAMLTKLYGKSKQPEISESRYSPAKLTGTKVAIISGDPDQQHIATSYVERQNLTMRMSMRRFTRLTNGFSKKFENHCAAVSLHMFWYNFIRVHQSLRVTPAMAAGVTDHLWEMADLVALIEARESLSEGEWAEAVTSEGAHFTPGRATCGRLNVFE
jgi:IS1 family transposase